VPDLTNLPTELSTDTDFHLPRYGHIGDARFVPGQIFASRYRIVSLLGRGAMGEVYRADDLRVGQPVALKLLTGHGAERLARFATEVRLARDIGHPNVCRVFDIGSAEGWHYLSMEYVDSETLGSLLRRIGRLPGEKALDIARQLCAGLAAAHDKGVLHRDIKPSNIMVDGRGRIRIMDFGLAVSTDAAHPGGVAGTPAYMAPEQLAGAPATEQTDLYALGLVLYEIFTGRVLFPVRTFDERERLGDGDSFPDSFLPGHERSVEAIIRRCLEKDPAARPASALAVAGALPGGDALSAALAEGRLLSPELIDAASRKEGLRPTLAWTLWITAIAGTLAVAALVDRVMGGKPIVPKPPEVLAERARDILAGVGHAGIRRDSEFWFDPEPDAATRGASTRRARFVYRESPYYLVPQNLFRKVTEIDPPPLVPGMASLALDPDGRLLWFSIVPEPDRTPGPTATLDWTPAFAAAGLNLGEHVVVAPGRVLAVAHDLQYTWERTTGGGTDPAQVTAASLGGKVVYFEASAGLQPAGASRSVFSTRRTPALEALLSILVLVAFGVAAVLARSNRRRDEGDTLGARRISVGIVIGAHHVPIAVDEFTFLLSATGWSLVWGGFTWLLYMGLEPYVRRLWPDTLISWTRFLSGRMRDPLVGRDVLVGVVAGICVAALEVARVHFSHRPLPETISTPALESLASTRHFLFVLTFDSLESVQYAISGLFFLMLNRVILRKTWLAAAVLAFLTMPLTPGGIPQSVPEFICVMATSLILIAVVLRAGLLAFLTTFLSYNLLTRLPVTLDIGAWYFGTSLTTLLIVAALATYGCLVTAAPGRARA
jgi:Protein kinase domain